MRQFSLITHKPLIPCVAFFICFTGCTTYNHKDQLFTSLDAKETGIDFINLVQETDSTKSFINEFGYMGGGVGIGDFNNDGLKDIFFTANQVSCRLYINKGNNRFEDITKRSEERRVGKECRSRWSTDQ